ncbi:MAG: polysaccharide pyruvyl transferase family protein [Caldisericia bacterium]|nr:polysaccharide pyruvyl transferase family protein [Caldisericia bacterium]
MEKILLGGYFGFENIGDDAILLSEISFLKKEGFKPIILTNKGRSIFNEEAIDRYNFFKIFKIKNEFKFFILGGGGLFQDKTSFRSLAYYIFLIKYMKLLGKKVILLNVGIGPIIRNISKKLLYNVLKNCDLIFLRDSYSFEFFKNLNNKFLSSDSTFYFDIDEVEKENKIGISIRYFDKLDLNKIENFLKIIIKKVNLEVEFIVFSKEEIEIARKLNLNYFYSNDPIKIIERIGKLKFLIGTRYHSIIFSILTETPFIALVYDIKVKNIVKEIGLNNLIFPEDELETWSTIFSENFKKLEDLKNILKEKKRELKERLNFSFKKTVEFIKNDYF